MSAFLCHENHIGALAAWAVSNETVYHVYRQQFPHETAQAIASGFARANIASVDALYPHHAAETADENAAIISDAAKAAEAYYFHPPKLSVYDIIGMVNCLNYQSCEVDGWETTPAAIQLRWIKDRAIRQIPEMSAAKWEFRGE